MEKKKFELPNLTVEKLSEELVIANLKLTQANEKLRQAEQARSEMFSNISHDLRSPITAIKNSVEILSDMAEYSPEKVKPLLAIMNRRIDTLEQLINDIFLLVSLDNNCKKMHLEPLPIGFFLEDFFFCREADSYYADRTLLLNVTEDLKTLVLVDPHELERVLDNLFTNAYKYSNEGDTISLATKLENDRVIVSVSDTGIGIAKEHITKVFDRCFIAEKARTPSASSTGLGLSITKSIIEHFNGSIWCESSLGEGSTFSFSLPIYKTDETTITH